MSGKLKTQDKPAADVIIQGHGSIILFWPQSDEAKQWFENNVDIQQKWGEGIAVEPRYVGPIIEALEYDGFQLG